MLVLLVTQSSMIVLLVTQSRRIVACEAQVPRAVFHRSGHPVTVALPAAEADSPSEDSDA